MANEVNKNVLNWMQSNIDSQTKDAILKMLQENEKELIDSFYKSLEFGTGGLRGKMGIGSNRMNKYTIGLATQGLANYLKKFFKNTKDLKVVVGYDTRNNSKEFAQITANVLTANNIKVFLFDNYRPTPEISFAIRNLKANAGIMITASHNPKEYNGYKVYWDDGAQVLDPHDENIINEVNSLSLNDIKFDGNDELIKLIGEDIDSIYISEIRNTLLNQNIFKDNTDLKVLYTSLHGTGYPLFEQILNNIGFNNLHILKEQCQPDGNFSTVKSPNPENPIAFDLALKYAKENNIDLIIATDPDADRVGVVVKNNNGEYIFLNGNETGSILAYYISSTNSHNNNIKFDDYFVKTIVTTDLIKDIADSFNIKVYEVLTGFKYIARVIKEKAGARFLGGFEESYGYLFSDIIRDKDGLMASLYIIEVALLMKKQGKTLIDLLEDIYTKYSFYYTKLVNIEKENEEGLEIIKGIIDNFREDVPAIINDINVVKIRDYQEGFETNLFNGERKELDFPKSNVIQFYLEDNTKITIRPSGTEPKMKIYFSFNKKIQNNAEKEFFVKYCEEFIQKFIANYLWG